MAAGGEGGGPARKRQRVAADVVTELVSPLLVGQPVRAAFARSAASKLGARCIVPLADWRHGAGAELRGADTSARAAAPRERRRVLALSPERLKAAGLWSVGRTVPAAAVGQLHHLWLSYAASHTEALAGPTAEAVAAGIELLGAKVAVVAAAAPSAVGTKGVCVRSAATAWHIAVTEACGHAEGDDEQPGDVPDEVPVLKVRKKGAALCFRVGDAAATRQTDVTRRPRAQRKRQWRR
eukprot:TRINITY_DN37970_c0_g1_i1.p1 TRINITY_DN37970_c0_g1~~TRINITY_DN37970_c0_g1_i1.p1  ORF type:complete len:264 (+),score=48.58 TRINITY_DN37970_c0_g1_i1:80-793(+)